MTNSNHPGKALFDMDEETLKNFHLGCGETMQETESKEHAADLERQAKMIDAVGAYRFPETWGDGLPA